MKKILLIEDDQVMRESTAEILELSNYNLVTAENGKIGVKLAKQEIPDLIICDIMMPELDGYGVLHLLSKDPKTSSIPFIFLTAKAEKSEVREGMQAGADDYLTKPFQEMDLLNSIEQRLKKVENLKKAIEGPTSYDQFLESLKGLTGLEKLNDYGKVTIFKKKQVIYSEGDTPQFLYQVNTGKVKVSQTHNDGKDYVTMVLGEGGFFGVTALLQNSPYKDSAIVLEEAELRKIMKDDFLTLIYKDRDISSSFIKLLSRDIEEREAQLLSLAYSTVRKRTAEALLDLNQKNVDDSGEIAITREVLASIVGTATETVIRCLSDLKDEGLIEVRGRKIIVLSNDGLKSLPF